MITLKRLNVVRKVATEEQAAKLERLGFARTGGTAEAPVGAGVTEADLTQMGEAMFERLSKNLKEAVATAIYFCAVFRFTMSWPGTVKNYANHFLIKTFKSAG